MKRKNSERPAKKTKVGAESGKTTSFPVVAIGASAGGLAATEESLRPIPEQSGLAVTIVQHLDPTHNDLMVELLSYATATNAGQVKDRLWGQPNARCLSTRIMPCRTMDNRIDGVVTTFVDLTAARTLEAAPRGKSVEEGEGP